MKNLETPTASVWLEMLRERYGNKIQFEQNAFLIVAHLNAFKRNHIIGTLDRKTQEGIVYDARNEARLASIKNYIANRDVWRATNYA